jgi:hypothetical protein
VILITNVHLTVFKTKTMKQITKTIIFSCLILGLFSCSRSFSEAAMGDYNINKKQASYGAAALGDVDLDKYEEKTKEKRKVIYNGSMTVKVKEMAEQTKQVIEKADAFGGYMVNSNLGNVTVRIPAAKLNDFMNEVATYGEVENRNVYSEDVTDSYADINMRLENAQKSRKRYLELLEKAADVTDILAVEKELERLNGEIERMQGVINSYDKRIEYSSVSVYFVEKVKPGPVGYVFYYLYKGVKFLFVRN